MSLADFAQLSIAAIAPACLFYKIGKEVNRKK